MARPKPPHFPLGFPASAQSQDREIPWEGGSGSPCKALHGAHGSSSVNPEACAVLAGMRRAGQKIWLPQAGKYK